MRRLWDRLRGLFQRHADWKEEIETHLAMHAELNEREGIAPDVARVAARRQFGSPLRVAEDVRSVHVQPWLESVLQDLLYASRSFRKHPLFTSTAIVTLAIGIGATTAVFSVVDPLLFRSLPYAHADRLVSFGVTGPIDADEFMLGKHYLQWHDLLVPFQSVTTIAPAANVEMGDRDPVQVTSVAVEGNFLQTFGVNLAAGNDFTADDDRPNAPPVALLSYGLWESRFGANSSILQRTIALDNQQTRIAGVLPKGFEMPIADAVDVLVPLRLDRTQELRSNTGRFLRAFGRLKAGLAPQQARDELQPFFRKLQTEVPPQLRKEVRLTVRSLRDRQFHDVRLASWMLFGAVLALLLLACANVANLLLVRGAARGNEFAVRMSLGAGRGRLIRQRLTETFLLAFSGGIGGFLLAWLLFRLIGKLPPEAILRLKEGAVDTRVLLFTLITCALAAVLSGIAPAFETPALENLTQSRFSGSRRSYLRNVLIVCQVAISVALLTGASLFLRTLRNLENQRFGFDPARVFAAEFYLSSHRYNSPGKLAAIYRQLEANLEAIPGTESFAISDSVPPGGAVHQRPFSNMAVAGRPPLPSEGGMVDFRYITPDYFRVLGIPVLRGRAFNEGDRALPEQSIVLSAKLARRLFGNGEALGQRVIVSERPPLTVVGIVADVKNGGLFDAALPEYYLARKAYPDFSMGTRAVALFRTALPADTLQRWIRAQVGALDTHLPVKIERMKEQVANENRRPRFLTVLIGLFATFGLLVAGIGLYGVISFVVTQRTKEIGVRIAVGATPRRIKILVLKDVARWTGSGIGAGLLLSFALGRMLRRLLFEISPHDPVSLAAAVAILSATALVAGWWPSRRAAKIDPNLALRSE